MNRLLPFLPISVLALSGCSTPQRPEPPAPVVSVPASPTRTAAPKPKPAPAPPKVQPIQVYAYQHPGEVPSVPPDAGEQQTVAADGAVQGQPNSAGSDAGAGSTGSAPGVVEQAAAGSPDQKPSDPQSQPQTTEQPPPSQQVATAPPPSSGNNALAALSPAAQALTQQAEQQRQMGDYAGAAATLERGLRISPQEAYLWNRLARVRLEQGLHSQAGNLAARSNSLAGNQPAIKQDNWRIIADARRRAGDVTGAQEAELKARGG